jgi:hypothetical protein
MEHERHSTPHLRTSKNLALASIAKIAAAANVKLGEGTLAVYLERLICLSPERLTQATNRTIEDWTKAAMMPPLPYILERSYIRNEGEISNDAPQVLSRPALSGEVESRETRQEYSARLIAEMRGYLDAISFPPVETLDDPEKRKAWATAMAKKQGWL